METRKAIRKRRCIRKFKKKDVSMKLVFEILDCGRWAPTAKDVQSWEFVIVKGEKKREIAEACEQDWVGEAPVVIIVCANIERVEFVLGERARDYALMECSAAVENILLAARDLGLGSAWVSFFDREKIRKLIGCPEKVEPVAVIPVGYPAEFPEAQRAPLSDFIHIEEFGRAWEGEIPKSYSKKWSASDLLKLFS